MLNGATWIERARFWLFASFLAACFLWGGGSRGDIAGLIILQPLALLYIGACLLLPGKLLLERVRAPLFLATGLALVMAVQLVPLPPELWTSLPGRAPFVRVATEAGLAQPWRPISLTPDLTLASLVGLSVPIAAFLGIATIPEERLRNIVPLLLIAVGLSILLGVAQIAGGSGSPFYFYRITNEGSPVGFFANRNHQAVLLAAAFPMLALWVSMPIENRHHATARHWTAVTMALFLLPMLLVTGSRAGLLFAVLGIGIAAYLLRRRLFARRDVDLRSVALKIGGVAVAGVALIAMAIFFSRDEALDRVINKTISEDGRVEYFPVLARMASDFFPIGSGFGSFDPVYRYYEPFHHLSPRYLNHAHNDALEIVITGGLPAAALALLMLVWLARRVTSHLRARPSSRRDLAIVAAGFIAMLLMSSIVDYPLRTPLLAALFAIACGFVGPACAPEIAAGEAGSNGRESSGRRKSLYRPDASR